MASSGTIQICLLSDFFECFPVPEQNFAYRPHGIPRCNFFRVSTSSNTNHLAHTNSNIYHYITCFLQTPPPSLGIKFTGEFVFGRPLGILQTRDRGISTFICFKVVYSGFVFVCFVCYANWCVGF